MIPSGFPRTSPSRMHQAIRLVSNSCQAPPENVTPALASANKGNTRNETQSFSLRVKSSDGDSVPCTNCSMEPSKFLAVFSSPSASALRNRSTISRPCLYTHLRAHETDSYLVCRLLL